jgi:hypothetical protein
LCRIGNRKSLNQNFLLSFNILFENKNESKTIRVTWYLYKQWEFLLLFKHSLNIAIIQLMVCSICKLIKTKNKKQKIVFNEQKLWKKTTAHSQNILHVDVVYNIKRKKYKTVCFFQSKFLIVLQYIIWKQKELLDIYVNSESSYFCSNTLWILQ